MIRRCIPLLMMSALLTFACENKPSEASSENQPAEDVVAVKKDSAHEEVKTPALTGKAAMVGKKWKAKEFSTGSVKLQDDLVDLHYDFRSDGSFDVTESGKKEPGTWKVDEAGKKLRLQYSPDRVVDYKVNELQEDRMVIEGKENGMFRTVVLVPEK